MNGMGRQIITMGLIIVAIGVIISLAPRFPWLGKLPGDIYFKKNNFSFYFPLGTCILFSLIVSLILWFFRR